MDFRIERPGRHEMTVGELIGLLEQYDEEAVVRLAIQPDYPFEHGVAGVTLAREAARLDVDAEAADNGEAPEHLALADVPNVVYIAESGQLGHLFSKTVFETAER